MCLTLDAVLAAYGVCFYQLQDTIDFAPWLASVGMRYLNVPPPPPLPAAATAGGAAAAAAAVAAAAVPLDLLILQRRVLWLIKCCLYPQEADTLARLCVARHGVALRGLALRGVAWRSTASRGTAPWRWGAHDA
jgi:hypothetical protein